MHSWLARNTWRLTCSIVAAGALGGCGSIDPAADGAGSTDGSAGAPTVGTEGGLLPWAIGNTWTYRVTKDGEVTQKSNTIGAREEVGGVGPNASLMAFHVSTAKGADDHTESWQAPAEDNPDRIVRYREQSFAAGTGELKLEEHWEPEKVHIDGSLARTVNGASWLESYSETKLEVGLAPTTHEARDRWTVLGDDETLEVPAGTFEHVIHFQKAGGGATKEYWYARGVGKLKEISEQTEELMGYSLEEAPP
jgi:hypothetical protein